MPRYQVQHPDGRKITVEGNSPPTDEDLDGIFSSVPAKESISPYPYSGYGLSRGVEAVQRGARLGDIPGLAFKATSGYLGGLPEEIAQKPLRTFRSLAQGLPSMGEIYRGEPEKYQIPYPKPVTEEGRRLGGELERWGNVAGITETVVGLKNLISKGIDLYKLYKFGPDVFKKQAEAETARVLKPSEKQYSPYLQKETENPAVEQMARIIKKAKSYKEMIHNVIQEIKKYGDRKWEIIQEDNFDVEHNFDPSIIEDLPEPVKEFINPPKKPVISRIEAQLFKERIDDALGKFYPKSIQGNLTPTDIVKMDQLARYRSILAYKVHGFDQELIGLDKTYGGMKQGLKILGDLATAERTAPKGWHLQDILSHIRFIISRQPHPFVSSGIGRILGQSIARQTGKIEKLSAKAAKYAKPPIQRTIIPSSLLSLPAGIEPKQLPSPTTRYLEAPPEPTGFKIIPSIEAEKLRSEKPFQSSAIPRRLAELGPGPERKTIALKEIKKRLLTKEILKKASERFRGRVR